MGSSESKRNEENREKGEESSLEVFGAAVAIAALSWGISYMVGRGGGDDKKMMKAPGKRGEYIKRDVFEKNPKGNIPCRIEEGLYLGSVGVALNKPELKRQNITHVLILAKSLDPAFPDDFTYKKIAVLDIWHTELTVHFDECFEFIESAKRGGGGVLVHCSAGRSRSVTIVVAYLMKKHRMSLSRALELVRSKRPQISPNPGFMFQLQDFEESLEVTRDATSG